LNFLFEIGLEELPSRYVDYQVLPRKAYLKSYLLPQNTWT